MITHRGGYVIEVCDGCWRPGEPFIEVGQLPEAPGAADGGTFVTPAARVIAHAASTACQERARRRGPHRLPYRCPRCVDTGAESCPHRAVPE